MWFVLSGALWLFALLLFGAAFMDGVDLAHEVRLRWPLLPVVLTSGHPLDEHMRQFPPGVAYIPKPWQPLNLLVAAEEALATLH